MAFKYRVLSIDGGGVRGVIPALILDYIEKKTNKNIADLFNLISGTSTGGILGLALTKPKSDNSQRPHYSAEDLIDLYRVQCPKIFTERLPGSFDQLTQSKFGSQNREEVLKNYLEETPLEAALTEVFITSYDIQLRMPVFFTSNIAAEVNKEPYYRKICTGFYMLEAAMATSAAPTYFPPYKIDTTHPTETGYYSLVDGGVFANNPTTLAMMEAMLSYKRKHKQELYRNEILIVSLGTGSLTRKYLYKDAKDWGLLKWVQPIINITMDAQSEAVACQLDQLIDDDSQQYFRFQAPLIRANDDMDDASKKNIDLLIDLAQLLIEENKHTLDRLCELLSEPLP